MCPVVRLLGYMVVLFLVFKGISILFSIVAVSVYIPTSSARGFPFLCMLFSIYCLKWRAWGGKERVGRIERVAHNITVNKIES